MSKATNFLHFNYRFEKTNGVHLCPSPAAAAAAFRVSRWPLRLRYQIDFHLYEVCIAERCVFFTFVVGQQLANVLIGYLFLDPFGPANSGWSQVEPTDRSKTGCSFKLGFSLQIHCFNCAVFLNLTVMWNRAFDMVIYQEFLECSCRTPESYRYLVLPVFFWKIVFVKLLFDSLKCYVNFCMKCEIQQGLPISWGKILQYIFLTRESFMKIFHD